MCGGALERRGGSPGRAALAAWLVQQHDVYVCARGRMRTLEGAAGQVLVRAVRIEALNSQLLWDR